MAILDKGSGVPEGAIKVRNKMINMIRTVRSGLNDVRELVQEHGRSNLTTEMGSADAAELLTLYNSLKSVLESTEVGDTVDPLP